MSAGILLECVSPISWVWKFLWVWVWVWIWKIFCGVLDFYVGHGIFFFCWTCRNFFLDMEFFWVGVFFFFFFFVGRGEKKILDMEKFFFLDMNFLFDMEFFWNEYFGTGCFVGISMIG